MSTSKYVYADDNGKLRPTAATAREKLRREKGYEADHSFDEAFKMLGYDNSTSAATMLNSAAEIDVTPTTSEKKDEVLDKVYSGKNSYYDSANQMVKPEYESQYDSQINDLMGQISSGKNSYYDSANQMVRPEYERQYDTQINSLIDKILNGEKFAYDINADSVYQQYRDIYERNAKKSAQNVAGNTMAASGGYANSYAQAAAQQAYNSEMQNLGEMIPEFQAQAYSRFADERQNDYNQLSILRDADNAAYGKYRDTVADYENERNYLLGMGDREQQERYNQLNMYQSAENTDYSKYRDTVADYENERNYLLGMGDREQQERYNQLNMYQSAENTDYSKYRDSVADYESERDYLLGMGDRERQDLYNQAGLYQNEEQMAFDKEAYEKDFDFKQEQFEFEKEAYEKDFGLREDQFEFDKDVHEDDVTYKEKLFNFDKEKYENDKAYQNAVTAAEFGDYSLLGKYLGIDTSEAQKWHDITKSVELYNATGMISFLKDAGLDTTELESNMMDEKYAQKLSTALAIYEATGDASKLHELGVNTTYSDELLKYAAAAEKAKASGSSGSGGGAKSSSSGKKTSSGSSASTSTFKGNETTSYWINNRLSEKAWKNYNSHRNTSISYAGYISDMISLAVAKGELTDAEKKFIFASFGIKGDD